MPLEVLRHGPDAKQKKVHDAEGYDIVAIGQLLNALAPVKKELPPEGARITVHAAVSRFAVLYERIRNAVDYREDHLLRKGAIQRILKRQLVLENDPFVIANNVIRELIGARYLPNGELPDSLIDAAALCIRKYQAVVKTRAAGDRNHRWLLGVVSAELEETLVDQTREKALVSFLYERLAEKIRMKGTALDDNERRLQIYVAASRSLYKTDEETAGYKLLRAYLPEWQRPEEWLDHARPIAERLVALQARIQERLRHPLAQRFLKTIKPWAVSLSTLTEALTKEKDKSALLSSRTDTHKAVADIAEKREDEARGKLRRGTIRAMVYLFLTKMVFALVIELPVELYLYKEFSQRALAINLGFPPILMFFVGAFIRRPGQENRRRIVQGVDELLSSEGIPTQEIRVPRKRTGATLFLMRVFYLFAFSVSFGITGFILYKLDFTWIATVIFFFFLCVVSFFGYRLRAAAREIVVVQPRERLSSTIIDFFSLPILRVGQWLSQTVSRLNVFVFLFDFLFEAPFKLFLAVLEDWLSFIKEKKEELTEQ